MYLLELENVPILEQLRIEEALLRVDNREWCILGRGTPPAIVMGISGKPEQLLHIERVKAEGIPVIKRFSGGGTVVVDQQTFFVTFIRNGKAFPKEILKWTEEIYRDVFPQMTLRENDYVFGNLKFGGNAQYIQKERWLHHTSFLWDYDPQRMSLLKFPAKRPAYRGDRDHGAFLCRLKEHVESVETIFARLKSRLSAQPVALQELASLLKQPHRKATLNTSL